MTREERIRRNVDARRASRAYCKDTSVAEIGPAKSARIDLGIALLQRVALPGVCYTYEEIAAWAGCTDGAIYLIEKTALRKLRNRWRFLKEGRLGEMMECAFEERRAAARKEAA